jgi:hypothetical protein
MIKEVSKPKIIVFVLTAFFAPLPTYAIDATGSGNFWGIVFGVCIVSFFLVFSLIPWLTYRAIKNGQIFWIVVTMILCTIGIYYSFMTYREIFGDDEMDGIGFLTFLLSSSVYVLLFIKTLNKISESRGSQNEKSIETEAEDINYNIPIKDHVNTVVYTLYQKYFNEKEVLQLIELLKNNKIEYQLEDHSPIPDILLSMNEHEKEFWIKLKKVDFETVDRIRLDFLNTMVDNIDPEYYLFSFSNQELSEVISNHKEWSKLDFLLAQKILRVRGEQQVH